MATLSELQNLYKEYGSRYQANIKLPGGDILVSPINPGQAATFDLSRGMEGVGIQRERQPNPFEIVLYDYVKSRASGPGSIADRSTELGASIAKRYEGVNVVEPTPGIHAPTIPLSNFPSGQPGIFETATGTLVNAQGQVVGLNSDLQAKVLASNTEADKQFKKRLEESKLSPDDKQAFQFLYDAIASFDSKKAQQFSEAFASFGDTFDPYFRAKARIVQSELNRGVSELGTDLAYQSGILNRRLTDLDQEIKMAKESLPIEQQNELEELRGHYETQAEDLAQRGLSFGSRKEALERKIRPIGQELAGSLVESSKRKFAARQQEITKAETGAIDVREQIKRLQEVAGEKRKAGLARAEESLGSAGLAGLGFTPQIGEIPGSLREEKLRQLIGLSGFVM